MIKTLVLISLLSSTEIQALEPSLIKVEANRKRGKHNRGKRRGGRGLR
jgi:hypothetical protein